MATSTPPDLWLLFTAGASLCLLAAAWRLRREPSGPDRTDAPGATPPN
ncbi:MAG: hypothetical protein JNK78_10170 [Planctomycetes bacterium]|nr:hypothetical protein [Planctomycetota bacterium]